MSSRGLLAIVENLDNDPNVNPDFRDAAREMLLREVSFDDPEFRSEYDGYLDSREVPAGAVDAYYAGNPGDWVPDTDYWMEVFELREMARNASMSDLEGM